MAKLNKRQNLFVAEYLIDLNATQAAIRAGYSEKTAEQMGYQLLQKTSVQEAIQEAMKFREQRTQITQDRVLAELAKIAFADGTDFARLTTGTVKKKIWNEDTEDYDETDVDEQFVQFVDTDNLPPEKKAAISGIKETRHGIEVQSYDKLRALELIGKHLGMYKDKIEVTGEIKANPFEGLSEAELKKLAGDGSNGQP